MDELDEVEYEVCKSRRVTNNRGSRRPPLAGAESETELTLRLSDFYFLHLVTVTYCP